MLTACRHLVRLCARDQLRELLQRTLVDEIRWLPQGDVVGRKNSIESAFGMAA
jgi:hypothetical protein